MKLNIEKDYYNDSFDGGGDDGDGDDDDDGDHDDESFLQTVVWKSSDVAWKRHNLLTTRPVSEWVNCDHDDEDTNHDVPHLWYDDMMFTIRMMIYQW